MEEETQFNRRSILVYVLACIAAGLLTELAWMVAHPESRSQWFAPKRVVVAETPPQMDPNTDIIEQAYAKLQQANIGKTVDTDVNSPGHIKRFCQVLGVSVVIFGAIGFVSGYMSRAWVLAGFAPALSFLGNNPVFRFQSALQLTGGERLFIIIFGQFAVCYALAYWGSRIAIDKLTAQRTELPVEGVDVGSEVGM